MHSVCERVVPILAMNAAWKNCVLERLDSACSQTPSCSDLIVPCKAFAFFNGVVLVDSHHDVRQIMILQVADDVCFGLWRNVVVVGLSIPQSDFGGDAKDPAGPVLDA
jgi:hypothetical protein